MSAYRNAMMEEGNVSHLRWGLKKAWAESDALRAENERLRRLLLIARPWIVEIVDRENSLERRVVLQEIDAELRGEIRAALPTETETPLEKHGISEE